MAGRAQSRQQRVTNTGPSPIIAQYVGTVNTEVVHRVSQRVEHPEAFYISAARQPLPTEEEQRSNIERKMARLGPSIVKFAQRERSKALIRLQKFASLSEYSDDHVEYVMELLETLYCETYVAELNLSGNPWVAYKALMDRLEEFAVQNNDPTRLPLNKPLVAGLLFNATGICHVDWTQ